MQWYERAKLLYPLGFMSLNQLTTIHNRGWITEEQFIEIKDLK